MVAFRRVRTRRIRITRRRRVARTRFVRKPVALAGKVQAIQRTLRSIIVKDHFVQRGFLNIPQQFPTFLLPYIYPIADPVNWVRTFGFVDSSGLEAKDKVKWNNTEVWLRFSLENATALQCYKINAFIISLKKPALNIFPAGIIPGNAVPWVLNQSHIRNNTNNQVKLNPDLFNIHKTMSFEIGDKLDGQPIVSNDFRSAFKMFRFNLKRDTVMENPLDSWKALNYTDLAYGRQLYFICWATITDTKESNLEYIYPQMDYMYFHTIQSV